MNPIPPKSGPKSSEKLINPHNQELEPDQSKVEDVAKEKLGFLGRFLQGAKQVGIAAGIGVVKMRYGKKIDKATTDAREALHNRVPEMEGKLNQTLPDELGKIVQFLQQFNFPKDEELVSSLIWIAIGNLAAQVIPEGEQVTTNEFVDRAMHHLMNFFGERFNALEAKHPDGHIPHDDYLPITDELFAQLIPIEGKIVNLIKPQAAKGIIKAHETLRALIMGQPLHGGVDLTSLKTLIPSLDGFVLKALTEKSLERDERKLAALTGQSVEETRKWAEKIAKEAHHRFEDKLTNLVKDILPENSKSLMQQSVQAAVTKLCLHAAENINRDNANHPHTVEGLLSVVQQKLHDAFTNPNPAVVDNLSRELIGLLLPNDVPYVRDFALRYEERYLPLVNDTLSSLFRYVKSQPQVLSDARNRFCAKVKNPESLVALIDHWSEKGILKAAGPVQKMASSSPLFGAGLKLTEGFEEQAKTVLKAFTWKVITKMVPDPAPGTQWESSEVFAKVLDRLQAFSQDRLRGVTEALKENLSEQERLERAKELSLPLIQDFIRAFVSNDLQGEIPLPEQYRAAIATQIENYLSNLVADELVKASKRALEHPAEPELADAIFTLRNQSEVAKARIHEAKENLKGKIDDAAPLIHLLDKQLADLSVKGAKAMMTFGESDQFSKEQLEWMGKVGKPFESIIQGWMWKVFAKMIPQPADGKKLPLEETLPKIFEGFERFADDHFPDFLMEARKEKANPEKLRELSKPVLQDFIRRFVSNNLAAELPVPGIFQKKACSILEDLILDQLQGGILRYVETHRVDVQGPFGVYDKYKAFLPADLQKVFKPLLGEDVNHPETIEKAKALLREKVADPDSVIRLVDQVSAKVASMGAEKGLKTISKKFLTAAGRPLLNPLQQPMEAWAKGIVWKIFTRLIPTPRENQKFQSQELMPRILENLVQFANGHFPTIMENIRRDWQGMNQEQRKEMALKLTKPMLQEFIKKFVSDNLEEEIPVPPALRKQLMEQIDKSLNDYAADALLASCGWLVEQKDNEAALNQMFNAPGVPVENPSAPVKACHAAGKLIEAVLPYQCREKHGVWAQMAFHAFKNWFPQGEPGREAADTGKKMVDSFLNYLGDVRSPEVKRMLEFMSTYAETALLKMMRQLGSRVQKLDEALVAGDPSSMEKALEVLMRELEPHFRVFGKNRKLLRTGDQHKILEAFRQEGLLHKAMDDEKSKAAVFQLWSAKFLALAGLTSGENLPVPSLFKDVAWDKLQVSLLPALLVLVFDKLKDPHMLDQVIRIGLEKINTNWNKDRKPLSWVRELFWPTATADYRPKQPVIRKFDDPYQKRMEEKVGRLGHLLARMESSPLIGRILAKRKIKKLVGQVVGQPLRGNLREPSPDPAVPGKAVGLNEVLGASLDAFVNHFMPCEKVNGQWVYFTRDEKGEVNPIGHPQPDFTEISPRTEKEKQEVRIKDLQRRATLKREVAKGTSRVIKEQLNMKLQALANYPWDKMVDGLVKMIRAISRSKHKDKAEMVVRKIFWWLRRYVLFPLLAVFTLPIWLPVRSIVNAILAKKGTNQIDTLKKDIHINLAYRVVDEVLHKLERDMHVKAPVV